MLVFHFSEVLHRTSQSWPDLSLTVFFKLEIGGGCISIIELGLEIESFAKKSASSLPNILSWPLHQVRVTFVNEEKNPMYFWISLAK